MAKHKEQEPKIEEQPEANIPETIPESTENGTNLKSLFKVKHDANAPGPKVTLKRTLTRPLVAAAHFKQLLLTCTSDMYTMTLPAKGRGAAPTLARVVDGKDVVEGMEVTLIVNQMIQGAWKRAGFKTIELKEDEEGNKAVIEHPGDTLVGHSFAFVSGAMNEEKGYRTVDVAEATIG